LTGVWEELSRYRKENPNVLLRLLTNGKKEFTRHPEMTFRDPDWLAKTFGASRTDEMVGVAKQANNDRDDNPRHHHCWMNAPVDNGDFGSRRELCWMLTPWTHGGIGLGAGGYSFCKLGIVIARLFDVELPQTLKDATEERLLDQASKICLYCGGYYWPNETVPLDHVSPTWEQIIKEGAPKAPVKEA
jgi:hypothetical protein